MKKSLSILLTLIIGINLNTQAEDFSAVYNGKTIYYITNSTYPRTVKVTFRGSNYTSYSNEYSGVVSIPDSVIYNGNYYKVTSIGNDAFAHCNGLTSITIPNSVTSIGGSTFYNCTGLTSITIGNSVTSIGSRAFYGCSGLNSITIPNSVTLIGSTAFQSCSGLTSITIPNSVTLIGDQAFESCYSLTSITIPNSVTSIGSHAFNGCTGLTSITIPNSITSLSGSIFSSCTSLTSITIPNSVTSIGSSAFRGCSGLTSINLPNAITSIGNNAFYGCSGLTSITIPNSVTSIGYEAFSYCSSLDTVYFNAVNCSSMGSSIQPTFYGCYNLSAVLIGDSVTKIPFYAFKGCSGLTSITIPNSVTSIGDYAFRGCSGLTSITIPNSVTSIGYGAFYDCSRLTSITIPNSVTSIGNVAFINCTSLNTVYFNAINCTSMGSSYYIGVFDGCNNFRTLIIGDSVQNIPSFAFYNCNSLTSIKSNAINPPSVKGTSFGGISKTIPFFVPCNSISSYSSALYLSEFTNYIGIGVVSPLFINDTICHGNTYNGYGFNFIADTTGQYTQNMQTINGCDSVIVLYLIVKPIPIIPGGLNVLVNSNFIEISWQYNGSSYIIYRNNDSLTTVNQPIYLDNNVVNGQSYCYKVKSMNGDCESEFSNIVCKTYLSLENINQTNISTKLYPNPTNVKASLEVEGLSSDADVLVYDMVGRVIQTHKINKGKRELDIDLSGYAKGIYSIRIMNDNINQTKKLIVK